MKLLTVSAVILLLSGCSYGDKYDNLKVVDGNGRVLQLKWRFGDNYFVHDLSNVSVAPNSKINKKLEERLKQ